MYLQSEGEISDDQAQRIEDAVNIIRQINEEAGRTIYQLDIYGRVDKGEEEWFENFVERLPEYVRYCGQVVAEQSVEIIKNYFALLFPTKYYTEGIPGTIIDAYFAGVPVVGSRWQSYYDIVDDNITGIGYEFGNLEDFKQKLLEVEKRAPYFNALKVNCLKKSLQYTPAVALKSVIDNIRKE